MDQGQQIAAKDWAPVFLRVPLALYFMFEGYWWMTRTEKFLQVLQEQAHLPLGLFFSVYAAIAPYLLFIAGILILLGWLTSLGAMLACVVYFPPLSTSGVFTLSAELFNRRNGIQTIVFLFAAFSLFFSGPGLWSLDSLRKSFRKKT